MLEMVWGAVSFNTLSADGCVPKVSSILCSEKVVYILCL